MPGTAQLDSMRRLRAYLLGSKQRMALLHLVALVNALYTLILLFLHCCGQLEVAGSNFLVFLSSFVITGLSLILYAANCWRDHRHKEDAAALRKHLDKCRCIRANMDPLDAAWSTRNTTLGDWKNELVTYWMKWAKMPDV